MFKSILAWGAMVYGVYILISKPELIIISIIMFLFAGNMFTEIRLDKLESKLKEVDGEQDK